MAVASTASAAAGGARSHWADSLALPASVAYANTMFAGTVAWCTPTEPGCALCVPKKRKIASLTFDVFKNVTVPAVEQTGIISSRIRTSETLIRTC